MWVSRGSRMDHLLRRWRAGSGYPLSLSESGEASKPRCITLRQPATTADMRKTCGDRTGIKPPPPAASFRVFLEELVAGDRLVRDVGELQHEIDHLFLE